MRPDFGLGSMPTTYDEVVARAQELEALGTRGISTEAIEELLLGISCLQQAGDEHQQELELLGDFWAGKLERLRAYFAC